MTNVYEACFEAGPSACAIYEDSADSIRARVDKLMDSVHQSPLPIYDNSDPANIQFAMVDYSLATQVLQQTVYSPYSLGPTFAEAIVEMEQGNGTIVFETAPGNGVNNGQADLFSCDSGFPTPFSSGYLDILGAIGCGDIVDPTPSGLQSIFPAYQQMASASPFFGPILFTESEGVCACVISFTEPFSMLTPLAVPGLFARTIRSITLSFRTQASL